MTERLNCLTGKYWTLRYITHLIISLINYGEGNSTSLQYSCLENPMDRGAWWATIHQFSSVQSLSQVRFFVTPCTAAHQATLSITNSRSLLKIMSIESVNAIQPSHPVFPFSSGLQSFPASGSFPMSQFFESGGQRIGVSASASVLPVTTQD